MMSNEQPETLATLSIHNTVIPFMVRNSCSKPNNVRQFSPNLGLPEETDNLLNLDLFHYILEIKHRMNSKYKSVHTSLTILASFKVNKIEATFFVGRICDK